MARPAHQFFEIDLVLAERGAASRFAVHTASINWSSLSMGRMPRPPPPQDAFSMTG